MQLIDSSCMKKRIKTEILSFKIEFMVKTNKMRMCRLYKMLKSVCEIKNNLKIYAKR